MVPCPKVEQETAQTTSTVGEHNARWTERKANHTDKNTQNIEVSAFDNDIMANLAVSPHHVAKVCHFYSQSKRDASFDGSHCSWNSFISF